MKNYYLTHIITLLTLFAALSYSTPVKAQSYDRTLGEVTLFAGNFTIRGWEACDGKLLSISQYTALYSIIGINYGGDGRSTVGLPNMTAPLSNMRYLIAMDGRYPSRDGAGGEYEAFIGEVILFSGNFVPDGWKECNGQVMKIKNNESLYSILGITYGGDGNTVFNLPNITSPANTRYIICTMGLFPSRR